MTPGPEDADANEYVAESIHTIIAHAQETAIAEQDKQRELDREKARLLREQAGDKTLTSSELLASLGGDDTMRAEAKLAKVTERIAKEAAEAAKAKETVDELPQDRFPPPDLTT